MKSIKNLAIALLLLITLLFSSGCAMINSGMKELESDIKGLDRIVTVYNNVGEVIFEADGIIRIAPNDYGNKVVFELNNKRYAFYNATVMVEEK